MIQAFWLHNLFQNTKHYQILMQWFHSFTNQLNPKHCKFWCFLPVLQQWPQLSCQAIDAKYYELQYCSSSNDSSLLIKQLVPKNCKSLCFVTMNQYFLPNNLSQSTANYRVLYPCWNHGSSSLPHGLPKNTANCSGFHPYYSNCSSLFAKYFGPKHWKFLCFAPMLKQWFQPSCETTCP